MLRAGLRATGNVADGVTAGSEKAPVRAVLLDIEGTTTPIAFVTSVLFPYARAHLRAYLEEHAGSSHHDLVVAQLAAEHAAAARTGEPVPPWSEHPSSARLNSAAAFAEWLMDRDRKSTALKELQGTIWRRGYEQGELVSEVFADVPRALQRWHDLAIPVGIFSSGSVLAQQLLFRHTPHGDLTGFLRWHFDTHVGAKAEAASYRRISEAIGVSAGGALFVSDVVRELDAARAAGMQVRLAIRPGNAAVAGGHGYPTLTTFDELVLEA